jgi:hypothetical protein
MKVATPLEPVVASNCCTFAPVIFRVTGTLARGVPELLVTSALKVIGCPCGYDDVVV